MQVSQLIDGKLKSPIKNVGIELEKLRLIAVQTFLTTFGSHEEDGGKYKQHTRTSYSLFFFVQIHTNYFVLVFRFTRDQSLSDITYMKKGFVN